MTKAQRRFKRWQKTHASVGYFREISSGALVKRGEDGLSGPMWDSFARVGYIYVTSMIGGTEGALAAVSYQNLVPLTEMEVLAWASQ